MDFQERYLESTKTEQRRKIILSISRPKTVTELVNELGYDKTPAVSKLLLDLAKIKVVVCLTPNRRRDRQYYLTEDGMRIRKILLGEEEFVL